MPDTRNIPDPLELPVGGVIDYGTDFSDLTLDEHAAYVDTLRVLYVSADTALSMRRAGVLNEIDADDEFDRTHLYIEDRVEDLRDDWPTPRSLLDDGPPDTDHLEPPPNWEP